MNTKLKNQTGFTIIEVLMVLAIAGLIMVIVFLAVPALQRNSRNTQRTNDASRVAAAINECTINHNGDLDACDAEAEIADYIDISSNQQLYTYVGGGVAADLNTLYFESGMQCTTDGTASQPGGGNRSFVLMYNQETSGSPQPRCVQG